MGGRGGRGGKRKRKERRGGGEKSGGKRRERSITLGQVTSNHTTQYAVLHTINLLLSTQPMEVGESRYLTDLS